MTYKATFTENKSEYLITFVDENGYQLVRGTDGSNAPYQFHLPYGTPAEEIPVPVAGDIPHKEADRYNTYVFKGWYPMINDVTGDQVYQATYEPVQRLYLIAHMNDDAVFTTAEKISLHDLKDLVDKLTETVKEESEPLQNYLNSTITFERWAGVVDDYDENGKTTIVTIRSDGNGDFIYTKVTGTLLQKRWMPYDAAVEYIGVDPVSTDDSGRYTSVFNGWREAQQPVQRDTVYVANYNKTENTYTVTWLDGDRNVLYVENVPWGTVPDYNGPEPTKTPIGKTVYTFNGEWSPAIVHGGKDKTIVDRDMTFVAQFDEEERWYSITFVDEDGSTVLKEATKYPYNWEAKNIEKPADPTKEPDAQYTYKFTGWEPLVSDVTCDMVYRATYNNNKRFYTITWLIDGKEYTEQVPYGEIPVYQMGATPKKATDDYYDYVFTGWDRPIVPVTKDATYEAIFAKKARLYTIIWVIGNQVISEKHAYGSVIDWPVDPTMLGYDFAGWDAPVPNYMPAKDLKFTALWNKHQYTVRFVNYDDTLLQVSSMNYLDIPVYLGVTPTKPSDDLYDYTFTGWSPYMTEVVGDTTFTALFNATLRKDIYCGEESNVLDGDLIAIMKASGKKNLKISWTKIPEATGYEIYFNRCNSDNEVRYVKLIATVMGNKNAYTVKNLPAKVAHKAVVRAFKVVDGEKVYLATSPMVHAIVGGYDSKYANPKSLKANTKRVTLKLGRYKLVKSTVKGVKAKRKVLDQGHCPLVRYFTNNANVAVVSNNGIIRAVGRGTCKVYAVAANGIYKTITVRVK